MSLAYIFFYIICSKREIFHSSLKREFTGERKEKEGYKVRVKVRDKQTDSQLSKRNDKLVPRARSKKARLIGIHQLENSFDFK